MFMVLALDGKSLYQDLILEGTVNTQFSINISGSYNIYIHILLFLILMIYLVVLV